MSGFLSLANKMGGERGTYGGGTGAYRVLVGKPEKTRSLRTTCRWEGNIKMDLHEVEWGAWIGLIWLRMGTGGGLLRTR